MLDAMLDFDFEGGRQQIRVGVQLPIVWAVGLLNRFNSHKVDPRMRGTFVHFNVDKILLVGINQILVSCVGGKVITHQKIRTQH